MHCLFNWVQNKLGVKQKKKESRDVCSISANRSSVPNERKEEFSDWPQALLAVGTFGNKNELKEPEREDDQEFSHPFNDDFPDLMMEEVTKLQKELTKLLTQKSKVSRDGSSADGSDLRLSRFLNCSSSLKVDRRASDRFYDNLDNNDSNGGDLSPNSRNVLHKDKDIVADKNNAIKQKSLSFVFKKMFARRSVFAPTLSLKDPTYEFTMEKLLRMVLHKKIYPQSSAPLLLRRYLEQKAPQTLYLPDKREENKEEESGKWVKTDSEYIVLEI